MSKNTSILASNLTEMYFSLWRVIAKIFTYYDIYNSNDIFPVKQFYQLFQQHNHHCEYVRSGGHILVRNPIRMLLVGCFNSRNLPRLWLFGPLVFALFSLSVMGCARVESLDRDGNRKVGWFMARGKSFVDSANARAVTVSGFGLHRAGPTWGLGVQKTRYVMLDERCRVVVLKDYAEQADLGRTLGLDLSEICIDQGAGAVSKWKTHVKVDGG